MHHFIEPDETRKIYEKIWFLTALTEMCFVNVRYYIIIDYKVFTYTYYEAGNL